MTCRMGLRTSCADTNQIEVTKIRKVVADFVMLGSGIVHRAMALRRVDFHAGCRIDSVYSQFKEHPMRSKIRSAKVISPETSVPKIGLPLRSRLQSSSPA